MSEATKQSNKPEATSDTTSGMGCLSQVFVGVTKSVDAKTIEGSTPGDHRVPAAPVSMDEFKNSPSPREQMRGQQDSRNYRENGAAFKSTSNSQDSDAGN